MVTAVKGIVCFLDSGNVILSRIDFVLLHEYFTFLCDDFLDFFFFEEKYDQEKMSVPLKKI